MCYLKHVQGLVIVGIRSRYKWGVSIRRGNRLFGKHGSAAGEEPEISFEGPVLKEIQGSDLEGDPTF